MMYQIPTQSYMYLLKSSSVLGPLYIILKMTAELVKSFIETPNGTSFLIVNKISTSRST